MWGRILDDDLEIYEKETIFWYIPCYYGTLALVCVSPIRTWLVFAFWEGTRRHIETKITNAPKKWGKILPTQNSKLFSMLNFMLQLIVFANY